MHLRALGFVLFLLPSSAFQDQRDILDKAFRLPESRISVKIRINIVSKEFRVVAEPLNLGDPSTVTKLRRRDIVSQTIFRRRKHKNSFAVPLIVAVRQLSSCDRGRGRFIGQSVCRAVSRWQRSSELKSPCGSGPLRRQPGRAPGYTPDWPHTGSRMSHRNRATGARCKRSQRSSRGRR